MLHISGVTDKTVLGIISISHLMDYDDPYHRNIIRSARVMLANEKPYHRYLTQYSSGATVWIGSSGKTVSVSLEDNQST